MLVLLQLLFWVFFFLFQRLAVTRAETASDLRVKASVIVVASVMNGGRASKKKRRCEMKGEGSEMTDLEPFSTTSTSLPCEVKLCNFSFKRCL